jgi:predicted 3-demethylubiquinone-9 3-methyltransferase (glyoxalase superfamily)
MKSLICLLLLLFSFQQLSGQDMQNKITTFLMFGGKAEEAMNFYISIFDDSEILHITRYEEGEAGDKGTVKQAIFLLAGNPFMCIDSTVKHNFTFTPSISLFVNCKTDQEITTLYNHLSADGEILMPLSSYPFSEKFAWVNDRYGVSWQLNLKKQN